MDKLILIFSLGLATFIISIYVFRCWKHSSKIDNTVIITSTLHSSGIICGIALALSPIFPSVKELISGIDMYIFIGGIAVFFVSSQAIHKDVIKATDPSD